MEKMINDDFVKYENSKNDEYIRLYATIIGIDNLISKASSAEEANALFKAKDVIYSQQKHFIYRQPDNGWISVEDRLPEPKTWVLVYIKYPSPVFELERGIQKMSSIKKMFYDGKSFYCDFGAITHWQPLPETRYIDAEALKKGLTRFYDNEVTARELIDEQPTVDVQPVKHGKLENGHCTHCGYKMGG